MLAHRQGYQTLRTAFFARSSIVLLVLSTSLAGAARAEDDVRSTRLALAELRAPRPWDGVGSNVADAFLGWNALYQVASGGATTLMVTQGVDQAVHRFFLARQNIGWAAMPGLLGGYVAPVIAVGSLYLIGWRRSDARYVAAGAAILQALTLSLTYTTLLKLVTGRVPPPDGGASDPAAVDRSRTFRFGFGRGGVYDGWPSGHTATAVSIGITLASFYDAWWIDLLGYAGSAYMMFSVSAFEGGVHWASDAVAAALMTYPIARAVGRGFRGMSGGRTDAATPRVHPLVAGGSLLIVASGGLLRRAPPIRASVPPASPRATTVEGCSPSSFPWRFAASCPWSSIGVPPRHAPGQPGKFRWLDRGDRAASHPAGHARRPAFFRELAMATAGPRP